MAKKASTASKQTEVSLEELSEELRVASGKLLETTGTMTAFMRSLQTSGFREYVDYMGRPWYSFWWNLLIGIARGVGFFLGATVVVALVIWIMSRVLTQLPFVGEFFRTLSDFLSTENLEKLQSGNFSEAFSDLLDAFKVNLLQSQIQ